MNSVMKHFLLAFDHASNALVIQQEFADIHTATDAYEALEEQYRDSPRMDIVLVGSDSIESVKITHSTYFPKSVNYADPAEIRNLVTLR